MFSEFIDKITFLLDNDLEIITLVLSLILGSVFAIPNALRPVSPYIIPMAPINATAISMFGSLIHSAILGLITLILCHLISKTNFMQRNKTRFNSYFFNKFNRTAYGIYPSNHLSILIMFVSTIPFCCPIVSCTLGYILNLDLGRNIYFNIIGLLIGNMLLTLYSFTSISRLIAIILYIIDAIIIMLLLSLPFLRLEKKIK